ncbi:thiamine pyrophosphate-dependent enzyme [Peribacillus cavernae]|nr:thiamine pyrophosphate-dependent enzyme [Peribacillus cavernae]MDQ0218168.1 acetolactate synthase-1/2/3 large subunit [Peribacillus cavernae]
MSNVNTVSAQTKKCVQTGGQAVVEVLRREGVEKTFCVPAESFLPVMDAMYDCPGIQLISTRHEGGAAFMAEAYAKASGKVGVCMATRGVGSTNLAIGIHTAFQDSTPMVALIGQVERGFRGREGFQEVDLSDFYSHITKWSVEISDPKRIPELLHRAFRVAQSGRPGPVLVSLPVDMLREQAEVVFQNQMLPSAPSPEMSQLAAANELLSGAKNPLIIVGGGVTATNSQDKLVQLSELTGVPVMTSFRRHDAFPNSHKHYAGQIGLGPHPDLLKFVKQADVILAIGMKFSQIVTQNYTLLKPETTLIHIDIDEQAIGKFYETEIGIVSDAKLAIQALAELNKDAAVSSERLLYCKNIRDVYETVSLPKKIYQDDFVNLEGLVHDLQETLPSNAILTNDAGNFSGWFQRYYQFEEPKTYFGPTSGAMGYSVPAAVGAKLAFPDRPVISIAGDGGFMMTLQELETALRYEVPIIALVINNNIYGTIRMHQEKNYPGRVIGTDLSNPDYGMLAKAFGVHGERVERNDQFIPVLQRALAAKVPTIIEVVTDPNVISVNATIDSLRKQAKSQG